MAGDFGFRGVLTQGGDEKFTPEHTDSTWGCFVSLTEGASSQQPVARMGTRPHRRVGASTLWQRRRRSSIRFTWSTKGVTILNNFVRSDGPAVAIVRRSLRSGMTPTENTIV